MWLPAVLLALLHAVGAARRSPAAAAPGTVSFVAPSLMLRCKATVAEGKQLQQGPAPLRIGVRRRQPTVVHFSGWGEPTAVTSAMRSALELLVTVVAGSASLGIILLLLPFLVWVSGTILDAMEWHKEKAESARQRREEERAKEEERMRQEAANDPKMEWDDRMREAARKNRGGVWLPQTVE